MIDINKKIVFFDDQGRQDDLTIDEILFVDRNVCLCKVNEREDYILFNLEDGEVISLKSEWFIAKNAPMVDPRKILSDLDINDTLYKEKVDLLNKFIHIPYVAYIIEENITDWCKDVGFSVNHESEDRTSWISCRL